MNIKKTIIYTGVAMTLLAGVASMAVADEMNWKGPGQHDDDMKMKIEHGMQIARKEQTSMIVQIGAQGNTLLRGVVDAVGTSDITVKTWGGDWKVNILATTNVVPVKDLTKFHVGDLVGVEGVTSQTSAFTIDAKLVRNWNIKNEMRVLKDSFTPRNWQGLVSNVNATAGTFTLTVDGTAYSVTVVAGAKIVKENYSTITLANISNGDSVRVWATSSGTLMTAFIVRDISVH